MDDNASNFLRRLIPFPGAEALSPLSVLSMPSRSGALTDPVAGLAPERATEHASAIVARASSVLDEEMARGVLGAQRANPSARTSASDPSNLLLRHVHQVVDQIATAWPSLQGIQSPGYGSRPSNESDAVAELSPPVTVNAGQRATISMTLCNSEQRPVQLVPVQIFSDSAMFWAASLSNVEPDAIVVGPPDQLPIEATNESGIVSENGIAMYC